MTHTFIEFECDFESTELDNGLKNHHMEIKIIYHVF